MNIQEHERRFCDINESSPNVSPHPVVLCLSPSFFLTVSLFLSHFLSLSLSLSFYSSLSLLLPPFLSTPLFLFFFLFFFPVFFPRYACLIVIRFRYSFFPSFFLYASDVSETGWFSTRTSVSCLIEAAGQRESRTTRGKRAFARKKIIV